MQTTVIWLSLFVLFLVIEIITMGLTTIWFAGGALVAFLVAVLGLGLGVQIIIFAIVSLALLAVTRPLAMKYFNQERQKTGAELLIGQKALVIEEIDTTFVKRTVWRCAGRMWSAKTDAPEGKIPKNAVVVVEWYSGSETDCKKWRGDEDMMAAVMGTFLVIILIIVMVLLISCVKIVRQAQALVIERLGAYQATWGTGLHFKLPIVDRVARRVDLKEQVVDFAPQPVITKDNVTMRIDTVVFYQITDPKMFCYGVANPIMAIENLTATTLRNIIGDLELDQTLTSRETINTKMRASLDVATDPWGIKVNRVELKNIIPPAAIQDAMEKQMKAERERREAILRAEGEKKSTILVAEGT